MLSKNGGSDMGAIAIVTLNDDKNYGNRLQNYALQVLLSKYGDVTTVDVRAGVATRCAYIKALLRRPKQYVVNFIKMLVGSKDSRIIGRRLLANMRFTDQYVKNNLYSYSAFSGLRGRFGRSPSIVVLGSDQVWNPLNPGVPDHSELLFHLGFFMPEDANVFSYAASFGISQIDENLKGLYRDAFSCLSAISVREDRGKELVYELSGREATVVLDPTLMIEPDDWRLITRNFITGDDKYVLTYFLGDPSADQRDTIEKYARMHNCHIRRLVDLTDPETYIADPRDFVELFSKAQYVFTDSYHACCFSIIFSKQFTVFNRSNTTGKINMNSRMETLFRLFNLQNSVQNSGLAPYINYEELNVLLKQYRVSSYDWLDKAIRLH